MVEKQETEIIKPEETKPEEPKKKMSATVKYIINIVIVLILTVVALVVSLGQDFQNSFKILSETRMEWLIIMLLVMVGLSLLRALILFCFARLYTRDYRYYKALLVESIGNFYSAVTPGATGGQVMEAYFFKKQGIHISNAVSMLAMYSIVYQGVLIVFGLLSFGMKYQILIDIQYVHFDLGFVNFDLSIWLLTIIGFLLNIGVILLVFLMAFWKRFHRFVMGPMVSLFHKIRLVRDPDKTRERLRVQVENFKIEFRRLWSNIPFTILVTILFIGLFILKFSMPFFAGKALGNQGTGASWETGFWDSIFLSNYHQMVTGLIPIPGSAGISEYFFTQLFVDKTNPESGFYYMVQDGVNLSNELCSSALLLWRTTTFTLPLIIAGFVTAFYRAAPHDLDKEGEAPSRETFIEAQRQTLLARETSLKETLHTNELSRKAIMERLKQVSKKKPAKKKPTNTNHRKKKNDDDEDDENYTSFNIES
ncbi:MAG: flippase-like domain-containing protein [Bacilli bacterium]|nr:flippase-like domain-containing protein [Bacilli bacterium]MBO4682737.1 flippase-like domain-containing protein [Bacilli bacterium]